MSTLPDRLRDLADHAPERLPERISGPLDGVAAGQASWVEHW